ncbi:MAG: PH domain-containing protein [Oscillospiraceae bacterium]|nr:PH domain-containing protein [Oscillospiraceae bacterium]
MAKKKNCDEYIWRDRKRIIFGLPWSFTVYMLEEEKLLISSGFLNKREDEVRLYRIMDLTLNRSLWERMFGLGTIHCCSADRSTPEFDIKRIKNSREVKNLISDMVEKQRELKRVSNREFMAADADDDHELLD